MTSARGRDLGVSKTEEKLTTHKCRGSDRTAGKKIKLFLNSMSLIMASMTSLLTHTVAHSTRPSFRPQTNLLNFC